MKPKFRLIAVMSLDGRIARDDRDVVSWGSREDKVHLKRELSQHDLLLMGRKTWEVSKDLFISQPSLVLTHRVSGWVEDSPLLSWFSPKDSDLRQILSDRGFKSVAVLGGSQIYALCVQKGWVDEIALTIEPFFMGQGFSLISAVSLDQDQGGFKLESTEVLNQRGTLVLRYGKNTSII